jgi:hypothetical protein
MDGYLFFSFLALDLQQLKQLWTLELVLAQLLPQALAQSLELERVLQQELLVPVLQRELLVPVLQRELLVPVLQQGLLVPTLELGLPLA